ncbi:MAG: YgjV family protein [Proteobacteria bacterium]|jgi:hypothetical protein|nr:YgjV family protein [Pseudomonadota bacterium]
MYILGQTLGVIGFLVSVYSFLQKDDRKMKTSLGISSVLVAIGYYMIGALTGSISMLISAARNFAAAYGAKNKTLFVIFLLITLVCGYYTYEKPFDVLPVIGAMTATTALFMFEGVMMRVLMVAACGLWMSYDVINWAIGPMMMEAFNIGACLFAIRGLKVQKEIKA